MSSVLRLMASYMHSQNSKVGMNYASKSLLLKLMHAKGETPLLTFNSFLNWTGLLFITHHDMPAETIWLRVGAQDIANQEDNFVQEVRITRMVENKRFNIVYRS